jgi:HTH-type transcriptional regulator/antitoxin HigA
MHMNLRPIRNEADYREAIEESERLWDARPGTPERDRLEVLAMLVDVYEREKFPIGPPDPIEAIKFRMEQAGLTRNDLLPIFGSSGRVSEVLNGRRALTIEMIRGLHERFGIAYEVLVGRTNKRAVARAKAATRKLRGEAKAKTRAGVAGQRKTGSGARVGAGR